ncbi:hypothetical protein E3J74_08570 [Candidatus Bathyarchaeota archaeon]|nr:MAG: hypothetical protein E3J74_08570 [Candidatus Bathyarchaeota archaeon]
MTKKPKIATILLIFFILLTLVSLLFLYYTHAIPLEKTSVTSLYTYGYQGTYNYIAALKPNTIYDNKTTLKPGEGPIYRRITDHIDVNFTYVFEGNLPANFTIKYSVHEYVETAHWRKQISELPQKNIETTGTRSDLSINNITTIDPPSIQEFVNEINEETGILASQYSLNITIKMYIEAKTSVGTVNESFMPTLKAEFQSSASEGEIISISGLEQGKTGEITETEKIYQLGVQQNRNISYGVSVASFAGLVISAWFFIRTRPPKPSKPEKLLEDIIGPYEEIIAEAAQEVSEKDQLSKPGTTLAIKTLEDLVKIADTLERPILHSYKPPETHIFRIIDDAAQYEFTTTISTLAKRKAIMEEEENE